MRRPCIVIVDRPDSPHGRMVREQTRLGSREAASIRWIVPGLDLDRDLLGIEDAASVVVPMRIAGATPRDRYTRRVGEAIAVLQARGIPVFVAAGNRRANLLGPYGIAVAPIRAKRTWGARLRCGHPERGSSGACARAAGVVALLSVRRCRWCRRPVSTFTNHQE